MCYPNPPKLDLYELLLLIVFGGMALVLMLSTMCGCAAPPAWTAELDSGTNAVVRAMRGGSSSSPAAASGTVLDGGLDSSAATSPAGDSIDFAALDWCYGGFRGGSAQPVAGCVIEALKVTAKGLSYSWRQGGCEQLDKRCTHDNACCTCALFCRINGRWVGGKFDHISTDRTTRGFENIRNGYNGWDASAVSKADAYAFVILDDGGKRRTNMIACER